MRSALRSPRSTPSRRVEQDFIRGRGLDDIDRRVAGIAQAYDHLINAQQCSCGGRFSLSAKPRCPRCDAVAFDSYFHDVDERNEPARSSG